MIHNGAGHLSARRNAPDPSRLGRRAPVGSDTTSGGGHSAAVTQKETASSQVRAPFPFCASFPLRAPNRQHAAHPPPPRAVLAAALCRPLEWLSLLSHDDRLDKVPEDHNDPSSPTRGRARPRSPGDKGGKFVCRRAVKRAAPPGDDLRRLGKVDKDDGPPMLSPRSLSGSELSIGASEHSAFDSVSSPSSANGSRTPRRACAPSRRRRRARPAAPPVALERALTRGAGGKGGNGGAAAIGVSFGHNPSALVEVAETMLRLVMLWCVGGSGGGGGGGRQRHVTVGARGSEAACD